MAIDRTSSSDDDNDELGVLDDLSTSTTAIDLGMTAQVSVVLPAGYQDDRDDDDDVIADELDPAGDSAEDADDADDDAVSELPDAEAGDDDETDGVAETDDDAAEDADAADDVVDAVIDDEDDESAREDADDGSAADADEASELAADDDAAEDASADEDPAEDEPVDEHPADEEAVDEDPLDDGPADEIPADEDPTDEGFADEDPTDEDSVEDELADEAPTDDVPADEDPAEDAPADEGSAGDSPAADIPAEAPAADADERAADSETDHTGSDEPADEDELAADSGEHTDAQPEPAQEDIIVREPDPKPAALSHDAADRVKKAARVGRESFVRQPRAEADMRRDPESSDVLTDDRLLDTGAIRKPEPEDPWRRIVYAATRGVINLGDGKKTRARKELMRRIAAPIPGRVRFVPVLSRKGGVGKTTVTALLGMALADARDDRVVAIDANPDRGTLAERISKPSGKTVRDLVRGHAGITGYADMTAHVTRDTTRLDVLASDADPHVADAFSDQNYRDVADIAQHYYSLVLTDTGTGIIHSVMDATLDLGDQIVIVSGISVDEARLAAETLTWLETNGHEQLAQNAVVVINQDRPGTPLVRLDELESHFRSRVRDVVRIPYDAGIATGSAISFHDLDRATRDAARRLAATVVEGIRAS
ncbi:MAG: nucleotide-binding protein [Candidatus Microbacterium stercoravium]